MVAPHSHVACCSFGRTINRGTMIGETLLQIMLVSTVLVHGPGVGLAVPKRTQSTHDSCWSGAVQGVVSRTKEGSAGNWWGVKCALWILLLSGSCAPYKSDNWSFNSVGPRLVDPTSNLHVWFDAEGATQVAFFAPTSEDWSDANVELFHFSDRGLRGWEREELRGEPSQMGQLSIAVGTRGRMGVGFNDADLRPVVLWLGAEGLWAPDPASPFEAGGTPLVFLDSTERAHILLLPSYSKGEYRHLVEDDEGGWLESDESWVEGGAAGLVRVGAAKMDSSGRIHLAYLGGEDGLLRYAWLDPENGWTVELIGRHGGYSEDLTLALSPTGQSHVVFFNKEERGLWHAWKEDGHWLLENVDASAYDGARPTMAFGPDSRLHLLYVRRSNRDFPLSRWTRRALIHASGKSGQWEYEPLKMVVAMYLRTAIGVDAGGQVHVLYNEAWVSNPQVFHGKVLCGKAPQKLSPPPFNRRVPP